MSKLSLHISKIKPHYTVVVIGSGYGGGVAASRLARAGQSVCVLERGKEFKLGEFPNTLFKAVKNVQLNMGAAHVGSKVGLFEYHLNKDLSTLTGCGVGGTSLINAGVVLKADPRVFENDKWPKDLVADLEYGVQRGYDRAEEMLAPSPYPDDFPKLKKLEVMERCAKYLDQDFYLPPVAITFKKNPDGINPQGVEQKPCILCGDCVIGCNHSAKNTVQMNYLPDARNYGAEIFSEVSVRYLQKKDKKWLVHFEAREAKREIFRAPTMYVSADIVILAAGTLGSTEILFRSRLNGLPVSERLGKSLTANGGFIGINYNLSQKVNGVGYGTKNTDPKNPPGPSIAGVIDTRKSAENYREGMTIEEAVIPGEVSSILPMSLFISKFFGERMASSSDSRLNAFGRELLSIFRGSYHGATNRTLTYLGMAHDSGQGIMYLEKDRLRIKWPDVGKEPIFQKMHLRFREMAKAVGGTYITNPIWNRLFGKKLISVHLMGGCAMAEEATAGVANHKGQIFSSNEGQSLHKGLYVSDGSIIPTSLGTNPILTITAISERNAALIAKDYGWEIDYKLEPKWAKKLKRAPVQAGFQFTETMAGFFSNKEKNDYHLAARLGKQDNSSLKFTLTIHAEDMEKMLKEQKHQAMIFGSVYAPFLSPSPLRVSQGVFNLFVKCPDDANNRRMQYSMQLDAQDGSKYYFNAHKIIRHASILSMWGDTTTLYLTIHDGENNKATVLGKGIINMRPIDFLRQSMTLKVTDAAGKLATVKYKAKFGTFFSSILLEKYGGIFSGWEYFNANAPPRQKRPLQISNKEIHEIQTADDVTLRLTRYKGGTKGPVILSHGAGVSSQIFSTDTVDTNLLEYLFAHDYDVWLLDFRVSIDLTCAQLQSSADDVAQYDYPAAVEAVLKITQAESVQIFAHCYGATTLTMSLLGGWLKGVRSVVLSQVSTHNIVPVLTKIRTGAYLPSALSRIGIKSLNAGATTNSKWWDKLINTLVALFHPIRKGERCNNPVCYRITGLYGQLYEHAQLNQLTHDNLNDLFGSVNIKTLEHLALITRKGHLVNTQGEESYLPNLERMAIPMLFISGEKNSCFLPKSTEITYNLLCEKNGKELYQRAIIPEYGHIDCIFGKKAITDVYPLVLKHLDHANDNGE